jgi:hypothetical protein
MQQPFPFPKLRKLGFMPTQSMLDICRNGETIKYKKLDIMQLVFGNHEDTAMPLWKAIDKFGWEKLASTLEDAGIRQIQFLNMGAFALVFALPDDQILRVWTNQNKWELPYLTKGYKDSRILQYIKSVLLAEHATKDQALGLLSSPEDVAKKSKKPLQMHLKRQNCMQR